MVNEANTMHILLKKFLYLLVVQIMSFFIDSTHRQNWLFNQEQLDKILIASHKNFLGLKQKAGVGTVGEAPQDVLIAKQEDRDQLLASYELIMCHFSDLISKTIQASSNNHNGGSGVNPATGSTEGSGSGSIQRNWRVKATAIVYFQRFFLYNSVYVHDPRHMMLVCIFLASKTEEGFIAPTELIQKIKNFTIEQFMKCEVKLLEGLNFDLKVYHCYNLCTSLVSQMISIYNKLKMRASEQTTEGGDATDKLDAPSTAVTTPSKAPITNHVPAVLKRKWIDVAYSVLDDLMVGGVSLSYAPAIAALYALKQAACKIPYPPVSKANPSALGAPQPNDASRNVSGSNVAESKEVNTATQPPAQQPPAQATSYLLKEVYQCWWDTQTEMNVKELESLLNHLSRWHNAKLLRNKSNTGFLNKSYVKIVLNKFKTESLWNQLNGKDNAGGDFYSVIAINTTGWTELEESAKL